MRLTLLESVGVGLRRPHFDAVLATERSIGRLEIIAENFVGFGGRARDVARRCAERWPIDVHGVAMSLGGPDPLDAEFVRELKSFLDEIGATAFSEHACFSSIDGAQSLDLLPLPFTEEAARHLGRRTRELAERLERPVLLENISFYAMMPGSDLDEGAYLRAVLEEADAFLLLDVNNVYVNARNHGLDPERLLRSLPLERTRQIHIAGHRRQDLLLLDDHGSSPCDEVLSLYASALAITGSVPTILEWDNRLPSFDTLLDAAERVAEVA